MNDPEAPDVRVTSPKQRARVTLISVIGLSMLVFLAALSVRVGAISLSWNEFFHAYLHYHGDDDDLIVRKLREPRVFVAIEVGAALAVAGAIIQGLTRNPLADTGLLGINAGAALFVIIGISVFNAISPIEFVWFAFPGAAVGTLLSFSLAVVGSKRPSPLKLTLAGVIVGSILGSCTGLIVFLNPSIENNYVFWAAGDVGGRSMSVVFATAPLIVVGLLVAMPLGRALNGLSLGEDLARTLGQRVGRTRLAAVVAVILLAGSSVAAAGPIAFVGLAIPNAVRTVVGNDYRVILPLAAVFGAVLVLSTDILARVVERPHEIETGVVISMIGAPIFVFLVSRRRLVRI